LITASFWFPFRRTDWVLAVPLAATTSPKMLAAMEITSKTAPIKMFDL